MFVTLFFLPSFDYPFHFMAPFLAMAELKQALFLLIWLNENVRKNVANKKTSSQKIIMSLVVGLWFPFERTIML